MDHVRLLAATAGHQTSAASAAVVSPDLDATVFAGANNLLEVSHSSGSQVLAANETALMSMIALRYPDVDTAKQTAARVAKTKSAAANAQIELMIKVDANGHRHVTDRSSARRRGLRATSSTGECPAWWWTRSPALSAAGSSRAPS
jgi:hypothetical protein